MRLESKAGERESLLTLDTGFFRDTGFEVLARTKLVLIHGLDCSLKLGPYKSKSGVELPRQRIGEETERLRKCCSVLMLDKETTT